MSGPRPDGDHTTAPHHEAQKNPAGGEVLDVVVVGGSQAGLAMACHLAQPGRRFVLLEAAPELGHTWHPVGLAEAVHPAQYDALPGLAFPAPADTYPTNDPPRMVTLTLHSGATRAAP